MAFLKLCSAVLLAHASSHQPGASAVSVSVRRNLPNPQTKTIHLSNVKVFDKKTKNAVQDGAIDVGGGLVTAKVALGTGITGLATGTTCATAASPGAAQLVAGGVNVVARGLRKWGFKSSSKNYIVFKGQGGLLMRSSSYVREDGTVKAKGGRFWDWAYTLSGGFLLKPIWVRVNFALNPDTLEVTKICTHGRNTRVVGKLHDVNVNEKRIIVKLSEEEHRRTLLRGNPQDALPYMMVKYEGLFDSSSWFQRHFTWKSNNIDNNLVRLRAAQLAFELREAQQAVSSSVGVVGWAKTNIMGQNVAPSAATTEAERRVQAVKDKIKAENLQLLVPC